MTGGRCPRRKKMMGRGPDGGCGTDERPCRTISRVPAGLHEITPTTEKKHDSCDVDFFSQAYKALTERSPFDVPEDGSGASSSGGGLRVSTLPAGLASLLKQSDSRKRHRKSHSGVDKKASRASERAKGGKNIWAETEEYFRDLALPDIDALLHVSSPLRSLTSGECLLIPKIRNGNNESGINAESLNENLILNAGDINESKHAVAESNVFAGNSDAHVTRDVVAGATVDSGSGSGNGNDHMDLDQNRNEKGNLDQVNVLGHEVLVEHEAKQNEDQSMEIDSEGAESNRGECLPQKKTDCLPEEGKFCAITEFSSGLEWLLGCRNRIILTSERPSKKRKLLGTDAGLEKVLIGSPCEGSSSSCDFCCEGHTGNESNRLIVCSSCKVAVHLKCYGVKGDTEGSWLCSWCGSKTDDNDSGKHLCVLCPKQGGALKPLNMESNDSDVEFAHLFCSLWMPEVYVKDLNDMEPIMGVPEIEETRRKLVCNICKVKRGACVRCSHGTCRAAFHPICAREARNRIEVWGKYGSDNVELRAFCSKHSGLPNGKQQKKIGRNGDNIAVHVETPDNISEKSGESESGKFGLSDSKLIDANVSECADGDQVSKTRMREKNANEDSSLCNAASFPLILRKLIDRGKVSTNDLALEMGISTDLLRSSLDGDNLLPDMQCKIVKWLRKHAYIGTLHKNLKVKLKSKIFSKSEAGTTGHSEDCVKSESGITDPVAAKSIPICRTKSNVSVLKDNKVICSSEEILNESGMLVDEVKVDQLCGEGPEDSSEVIIPGEKTSMNSKGIQDSMACLPKPEGSPDSHTGGLHEKVESGFASVPLQLQDTFNKGQENLVCSDMNSVPPDLIKIKELSRFYMHPYIQQKLLQMQNGKLPEDDVGALEGIRVGETSSLEASSSARVCCDHQNIHSKSIDDKSDDDHPEQLIREKKQRVCDLSPADEVEGEIIYFQHKLLDNAAARKHFTDNLISKVAKTLPQEIDATKAHRWDAVLVNQYLNELREAKKQGRKERKHKEAQAVLAAATAAAAASSRISSFRKDNYDDSTHQEKFGISNGRAGISSQLMPRPKETLSRVAVPRNIPEKYSDLIQSEFSKEHPRSCDICRRFETILNPILVCSSCKVAVHLDCYRSVKEFTGPWYCELCEELLSSKCTSAASLNFLEKPYFVAECGLCPGTSGAFRRSTDNHWVHAFCAEWVFEHSFRRGQVNPVEGMETVAKGIHLCCICHRKYGVCIKCGHGHCQSTFHPSCARSAGLYMNVKTINGKLQHKAYCEKHGLEQRSKAETQKHGAEELKSMKQIRVELERLRLLCERIIKREKIKRELVLCSHSILAFKRDHVARSVLVQSPFFRPDVSSESATTSLKGNTDGYNKSCSDAVQRSDDVTVDSSTVSIKPRVRVAMDADQKTDDSTASQNLFPRKPLERLSFAGKKIPLRASLASRVDDGEWSSKSRKRFETLEKEMVMTSDQASMKNQQLPKGYFYIPVDCLPKEKQVDEDACSGEHQS